MKVFERYFERNKVSVNISFPNAPKGIIVIPVLNDRDIFATLYSLKACRFQEGNVGVIVVVNHSEQAEESVKQINHALVKELKQVFCCEQTKHEPIYIEIMETFDLPRKYAGVGLARKLAMDAAAFFFYRQGTFDYPICSLDADTWVDENYSDAVIRYFRENPVAGVSVAYAHRYEECEEEMAFAMIKYELYLRYYQQALSYTGHPHAFHCIGSAFAVRTSDYVEQGGMNKRQAGEDFYFLQKLIATGRYATLQTTRVYPSARFSTRTPFGTGQTVRQIVEAGGIYPVYHFRAFQDLKFFFSGLPVLFRAGDGVCSDYFSVQTQGLKDFLEEIDALSFVRETNENCASQAQFIKRFFVHFNAFRVLKYLNFVHEKFYEKVDIQQAIVDLFRELNLPYDLNHENNLDTLRRL